MNICFLHTVAIDPQKGGIEKVTKILADAFVASGNTVLYLSMMDVFRETCDQTRQSFFPNSKRVCSSENETFLRNFLRERKIELVVFQAGDDKRVPFPWIFKEFGVRLIVAIHTDPEFYKALVRSKFVIKYGEKIANVFPWILALKIFWHRRKQIKIYRGNAAVADRIVLLSQKFVPFYSSYIRAEDCKKITFISNPAVGIENPPTFEEKRKEILYVGRMSIGEKRIDLLLKIWAKLEKVFPQWSLCLVGAGGDFEKLKKMAGVLNLTRVSFEGFQNPEMYYRRASIFCLTSAFEGFGLAMVEAASAGCVPVAFNSYASAEEIINSGENGFLVPAFDLEKYVETLAQLMKDNVLRERLANAARENAKRFEIDKICEQWVALFCKILNNLK